MAALNLAPPHIKGAAQRISESAQSNDDEENRHAGVTTVYGARVR